MGVEDIIHKQHFLFLDAVLLICLLTTTNSAGLLFLGFFFFSNGGGMGFQYIFVKLEGLLVGGRGNRLQRRVKPVMIFRTQTMSTGCLAEQRKRRKRKLLRSSKSQRTKSHYDKV